MKKSIVYIFLCSLIASLFGGCSSCKEEMVPPIREFVYVTVHDTINEESNIDRIIELEYELTLARDSLMALEDSIGVDLFVAKYKLARLQRYVDICERNSTQKKFFYGWAKRVLKE